MTIDLTSGGSRVGLRIPGFCETFDGDEGDSVSSRWVDFKDYEPDNFSRAVLTGDGSVTTNETVLAVEPDVGGFVPGATQLIGHTVIGREMGSANGELTVDWDMPEAGHFLHQVSPAFALDLSGEADPLQLGVTEVWDAGITFTRGYSYAQNVFSGYLPWSYDPALYYRALGDDIGADNGVSAGEEIGISGLIWRGEWNSATAYEVGDAVKVTVVKLGGTEISSYRCLQSHTNQTPPARVEKGLVPSTAYWEFVTTRRYSASAAEAAALYNEGPYPPGVGQNGETDLNFDNYPTTVRYTVRVVDGWYQAWTDGIELHHPTPLPSWAVGRDGWGIHVINITWQPGTSFPFGTYPLNNLNFRVSKIMWRPYDTPLV